MRALDAATGATLWSYHGAGASVNTGAAVVNGVVYWGSGYAHLGIPGWTGSTTFYAFSHQRQVSGRAGPRLAAAPAHLIRSTGKPAASSPRSARGSAPRCA